MFSAVKATCNSMIKIFGQNFGQNFTVDEERSTYVVSGASSPC